MDDTIDVDGINLFDLRQTKKVSESQYKEMEVLESRRRELMGELQRSKLVLENIFQTETFNDLTGKRSGEREMKRGGGSRGGGGE